MQTVRYITRSKRRIILSHGFSGLHTRLYSGGAVPTGSGQAPAISKLLVANRGEIACRVLTSARRLGIPSVAVYSEADRQAKHVALADEAYCIGPAPARESYLLADRILAAAQDSGATAVHPGYGFLSENTDFAAALEREGLTFVGPPASAIRAMGDKSEAKALMSAAGVPVVPGYLGEEQAAEALLEQADRIGYPVLIKAVLGGGGKGMKLAETRDQFLDALAAARREALTGFGDDRVLLERYIQRPRHIEVQVVADAHDNVAHLFERDCSVQRRHQKVIEEAPAPGLSPALRDALGASAVAAARAVGYRNAGTVEFILDTASGEHFFMEMNTRLQVEHPVTEAVTGVDLVEWQLRVAAGEQLPCAQEDIRLSGHAFEARIYAENPARGFLPAGGVVRRWVPPAGASEFEFNTPESKDLRAIRVDSGVSEGASVGVHYDPMIAKLIVRGQDRAEALNLLDKALGQTQVAGLPTNVEFVRRVARDADFQRGGVNTSFIPQKESELLAPEELPAGREVALAALLLAARDATTLGGLGQTTQRDAAVGPWAIDDSFRLSCPGSTSLTVEVEGQPFEVTLERQRDDSTRVVCMNKTLALDDNEEECSASTVCAVDVRVDGDSVVAELDGKRERAQYTVLDLPDGAAEVQVLELWLAGGRMLQLRRPVTRVWRQEGAGASTARGGEVTAPMPGKVVKVHVSLGEPVTEGQPLVAVEAMKMEHSVLAPCDGVVAELSAKPGQQVADGHVLVVLAAQPIEDKAAEAS